MLMRTDLRNGEQPFRHGEEEEVQLRCTDDGTRRGHGGHPPGVAVMPSGHVRAHTVFWYTPAP